jgi:tetratricopeptide (TPR) repeat protein
LGNEEYKKKNFEAALAHYNKAIELEPTNMTFYNNVAGKMLQLIISFFSIKIFTINTIIYLFNLK